MGVGRAGVRVWNTLSAGQLVNFVGMHLEERRCINIRSLPVYCVSRSGGGGAGGPQMPFVKKDGLEEASEGCCLPTGSPQGQGSDPGEGRGDGQLGLPKLSSMSSLHQAEGGIGASLGRENRGQLMRAGRSHFVAL